MHIIKPLNNDDKFHQKYIPKNVTSFIQSQNGVTTCSVIAQIEILNSNILLLWFVTEVREQNPEKVRNRFGKRCMEYPKVQVINGLNPAASA